MMKTMISKYVRTMFDESRDGELIAGDADNQFDYSVEWDEETANMLAEQCGALVAQLTELSHQYEKHRTDILGNHSLHHNHYLHKCSKMGGR